MNLSSPIRPLKARKRCSKTQTSPSSSILESTYKKLSSKLVASTIPRRVIRLDRFTVQNDSLEDRILSNPSSSSYQPTIEQQVQVFQQIKLQVQVKYQERLSLQELSCIVNDEELNIAPLPNDGSNAQISGSTSEEAVQQVQICRSIIKPTCFQFHNNNYYSKSATKSLRQSRQDKIIAQTNKINAIMKESRYIKGTFYKQSTELNCNQLLKEYEQVHSNALYSNQPRSKLVSKRPSELQLQLSPNRKFIEMTVSKNTSARNSLNQTQQFDSIKKNKKGILICSNKRNSVFINRQQQNSENSISVQNRSSFLYNRSGKYPKNISVENQEQVSNIKGNCCE